MKFGLTNVQTHRGPVAQLSVSKRTSPSRYKVRWPLVFCVAFCLAFWIAAFFGVTALLR